MRVLQSPCSPASESHHHLPHKESIDHLLALLAGTSRLGPCGLWSAGLKGPLVHVAETSAPASPEMVEQLSLTVRWIKSC